MLKPILRAACALLLLAFALPAEAAPDHPLILISIDGFRADYLGPAATPRLAALAAEGSVAAQGMIPSFPSVTFPNHTTLVTGLWPDHHGIVNNGFTDPAMPGTFTMASKEPAWWAAAVPIWVTAEKAGLPTGVMFWPGVAVPHDGVTPRLFRDYDRTITPQQRVATVLDWFGLPQDQRPRFATLYFEAVDSAGHAHGPGSPEVAQALRTIDTAVGQLVDGLTARGITPNLVIVADHGMAAVGPDNLVLIDDAIDPAIAKAAFEGTIVGLNPATPDAAAALAARITRPMPHMQCWPKAQIPPRLHYGTNPREPAVICQVETGWLALRRASWTKSRALHPEGLEKGAHGYAIDDPTMAALFIAHGPAFRGHLIAPRFPNVDVYPLMARVLGITPLPNDGNLAEVAGILR